MELADPMAQIHVETWIAEPGRDIREYVSDSIRSVAS
jgi:hypothetical protein